jgi:hypothetical protein
MINDLKSNELRKNLLIIFLVLACYLVYSLFLILDRSEARLVDSQTEKINNEINDANANISKVNSIIRTVEAKHLDYLSKLEEQKNLTIDANILYTEMDNFINLINQYYNNSIFKLRISEVKQHDDYINVAEINIVFDFAHPFLEKPEIAKEIEDAIIKNVYFDLINNFKNVVKLEKDISSFDLELKTIKLSYVKEK